MIRTATLKISNISKCYKNGVQALDNLSLEIKSGMFGLLGPNGAGKSSLMRTIATLQKPDSGSVFFGDIDVLNDSMSLRKVLGYLPQEFGVYPGISAEDLLEYFATLKGIASVKERKQLVNDLLEVTNLIDVRKKNVEAYSGGMKQRFGIAQLLLNDPQLIIVDEPTAGLDPAERNRFLNVLREIASNNIIIFSTHIIDDVKDLCNELAIINGGRILRQTTPKNAVSELDGRIWSKTINASTLVETEQKYQVLSSSFNPDNSKKVRVFAEQKPGKEFVPENATLEDAYFLALKTDESKIRV
ncbi:MAG: ATP-binding cassette domain-containing protein [Caldithrix sp.]|nr:ATP-binding cassette domain-containing protein [Caldithrix sp.]